MQITVLSHLLTGYVSITVEGYSIEKFINQARRKGIFLWDLDRERNTILKAKIGVRDFKKIRKIARKTKCGIRLEEKKGLPFFLRKYRKRKIFFLLLAMVALGILLLSQFVWNIEVQGNEEISTEEILRLAKDCGIEQGIWKGKIDSRDFTNRMRLEKEELAWVGVEIKGTNITIQVVEAEKKPEMISPDEYCQIVARKEGAIQRIQAQNGTICVAVGDLVKPGDVLISGTMEGKYTGVRNVHAIGEVWARTWYTKKEFFPFEQEKKTLTGREEKKYEIKLNNFQINLYKTLSKFEKYDTIKVNQKCKIFSNFYLPLELTTLQNQEYEIQQISLRNRGIERTRNEKPNGTARYRGCTKRKYFRSKNSNQSG